MLPFIYGSCNKERQAAADCDKVMCTMMFAMITAEVKDAAGVAATADEVYTVKDGTKDTLRFEQQMLNGQYVVMDDSYVKELQNKTAGFHFMGMKDGRVLFNEAYSISADCCHVKKESGKAIITLP